MLAVCAHRGSGHVGARCLCVCVGGGGCEYASEVDGAPSGLWARMAVRMSKHGSGRTPGKKHTKWSILCRRAGDVVSLGTAARTCSAMYDSPDGVDF